MTGPPAAMSSASTIGTSAPSPNRATCIHAARNSLDAPGTRDGNLIIPLSNPFLSAAARALGRPGAADAVAELVMAAATRRPFPDTSEIERLARGSAA